MREYDGYEIGQALPKGKTPVEFLGTVNAKNVEKAREKFERKAKNSKLQHIGIRIYPKTYRSGY